MRPETASDKFGNKDSHDANLRLSINGFCDFWSLERPVMPALIAGISIQMAMRCRLNRYCRDKRGNDESGTAASQRTDETKAAKNAHVERFRIRPKNCAVQADS
jgi:hypothetical protein